MKYSELISFNPIEDIIQLTSSDDANKAREYVKSYVIYEHDLNWASHNIFREGYLFMGLPGERSTAQPERDFYIHIMPPYGKNTPSRNDVDDEVYF